MWLRKKSAKRRYASSRLLNASVLCLANGSSDADANLRNSAARSITPSPAMGGCSWFLASRASARPGWQMSSRRGLKLGDCGSSGGDAGRPEVSQRIWPIIQIIRMCAERPDFEQLTEALGPGIEQVGALVPEILRRAPVQGERTGSRRFDPEQARFRLFDAVATLLKSVARREPRSL
jgi:hypothetical protein